MITESIEKQIFKWKIKESKNKKNVRKMQKSLKVDLHFSRCGVYLASVANKCGAC